MDLTFQVSMHYCSHSIGIYLHHAGSTVRRYPLLAAQCWRAAAMHWRDWEQIPHIQVQKSPSKAVGTWALATWHWSSGYTPLEWLWGDTPHPRAKGKPQQDGRRRETAFRNKPHNFQRGSEGSTTPCLSTKTQTPHRDWDRTVFWSPEEVWVSSGLLWGQGLWVQ